MNTEKTPWRSLATYWDLRLIRTRQWGKTTLTAMRAVHRAVTMPGQQIVVANKCREFAHQLHLTLRTEAANKGSIVFPNGSVIARESGRCRPIATGCAVLRPIF